ncbi:hypothetical protein V9T40_001177 [Parthenolecanium corni]|uniref:Serine carboxypeptidase n=1 Tax=Parthenolecanium corni TaxID=536013 RepID=A0AAN9TEU2_9HEMI
MARISILLVFFAFLAQYSCSENQLSNSVRDVSSVNEQMSLKPAEDSSSTRNKASVRPFAGQVQSYSGFLSVEPKYNAKLFYWFFEKQTDPNNAPIMLWLYGEIGRSSMLSVFEENGPYVLVKDKVVLREHSWTKEFNMLYIDSTVGTGYSTANSTNAYPKTSQQAAAYLYTALKEFFSIYDSYNKAPVYLAGEYYATKIIISLANLIRKENSAAKVKIELKKVCLGAGHIDPVNQQRRAEFLYQVGVVDPVGKAEVIKFEDAAHKAMLERKYGKAKSHTNGVDRKIKRAGYAPPVDAAEPKYDLSSYKATIKFFESKDKRQDLHAGDAKFQDKPRPVLKYIRDDLHTSSSKELVEVLQQYSTRMYTGQYDMVVPTSQYDQVIERLPWDYTMDFSQKSRNNWYINGKLAGYFKWYKNLYQIMVRQANHFVARSQPYVTMKACLL